ncbi:LPD29 domain-containing protein [Sphingomonas montana]|uniref:LPD29 domain-containing protein n=1 Tax=Sphingomonas montana TaxID=1843236 RepID=UPI00096E1E37|nr:LPD29 domain-containing protein [Sphingomonas montana]
MIGANDNQRRAVTGSASFVPAQPRQTGTAPLVIGSHVRCILPHAGDGIVYAIEGTENPASVRTLGNGIVVEGGRAFVDVVWLNGNRSRRVPEAIVRSVQWTVRDTVAGDNELKSALANAEQTEARNRNEATTAAQAHAAEVARVKIAPELAALEQGDDQYSGTLAAKNLRKQLKAAFPGIPFSVRKRHHGSVTIAWTDGPTTAEVEQIASAYKGGSYDGMDDSYSRTKSAWCETFGGADYISTAREFSDALLGRAIVAVLDRYAGNFETRPEVSAEDYRKGRLFAVSVPDVITAYGQEDLQSLIRQQAATMTGKA